MPYVTEEHDATYTSVSGLGVDPGLTPTYAPTSESEASQLARWHDVIAFRQAVGFPGRPGHEGEFDVQLDASLKVLLSAISASAVVDYSSNGPAALRNWSASKIRGSKIPTTIGTGVVTAWQRFKNGLPQPPPTGGTIGINVRPPASTQPSTQARPVSGDPVKEFQDLVGATVDGKYGPNTHSRGQTWAGKFGKKAAFKKDGPAAVENEIKTKRSNIDIDALIAAYKTWKARQVSSPAPAVVTPEMSQEAIEAAMASANEGLTDNPFVTWFENYWWAVAAVAVLGVGGVLIWQKMKKHPALPAAATAGW